MVIVYPLMNPDGVDEGHWRHNTGGIDLNRDWAHYNQPETRQVALPGGYIVTARPLMSEEYVLPEGKRFAVLDQTAHSEGQTRR